MTDFDDWTRVTELLEDVVTDVPDWTETVEQEGGGGAGYKSLTGAGQTVTPGELDQAGRFVITSGSMTASFGINTPFTDSVVIGTGNGVVELAGLAVEMSGNGITMATNPGDITMDTLGNVVVNTGGFIARESAAVTYGIAGAGAGSLPGITLEDLGTSTTVGMFVHHGSPVGVIVPGAGTAAICFDTATPKLWGWAQGASAWVGI